MACRDTKFYVYLAILERHVNSSGDGSDTEYREIHFMTNVHDTTYKLEKVVELGAIKTLQGLTFLFTTTISFKTTLSKIQSLIMRSMTNIMVI